MGRNDTAHRVDTRRRGATALLGAGLAAAGLLAALAGCASEGGSPPVDSSLGSLGPSGADAPADEQLADDEIARRVEEAARLLDGFWNEPPPEPRAGERAPSPTEPEQMVADARPVETPVEAAPPPPERLSREARLRQAAREAEAVLREMGVDDPYAMALRLSALAAARGEPVRGLSELIDTLPVDEREAARAVLEILGSIESDPAALAGVIEERAAALSEAAPLSIRTVALCSRVEGFGRYSELASDAFVAGSPMRMVVYTEVDHFDHVRVSAPAESGGATVQSDRVPGYEVRLSQELLLYHEADGLLAWRRPDEVTVYRSRSRLRDYFVVNPIELPRRLTVGAYRLKVVMRDLSDGSVDERVLPIRVVADDALATGYGG